MVQQRVNDRFGKCLLELSGNNAITVMGDADIPLVVQAVLHDAVGIAGQCRITCHRLVFKNLLPLTEILYGDRGQS